MSYSNHPAGHELPKTCAKCGKPFLFWQKRKGRFVLHHYADLADGMGARFIPHRCGFASDGSLNLKNYR